MNPMKLQIIIDAQNKADAVMKDVSGQFGKLSGQIDALQPAFIGMAAAGTAAFAGMAAIAGSAVSGFLADQKDMTLATSILENAVNSLTQGGLNDFSKGVGTTQEAMAALTEEMAAAGDAAVQLGYDDEAAAISFAKLYAISKDVGQAQDDLALAMDLAAFSGRDLESAVNAVTQVHAGGTRVLKEFGIEVKEGATSAEVLAIAQERVGGTAAAMSETTTVQMERMRLQWENIKSAIGGVILEAIDPLMEKIVPLVERITLWAEENPKLIATIMAVIAALGLIVAALGTLGVIIPAIVAGIGTISTALGLLGTVFTIATGPIGLVVLAITGLIAIGVLLVKHWDEVSAFAGEVWEGIKNSISDALNAALAVVTSIGQAIADMFWFYMDFLIGAVKLFLDFFFPGWDAAFAAVWNTTMVIFGQIKAFVSGAMTWLLNSVIAPVLASIKGVWDSVWGGISSAFGVMWEGIKNAATGALNMIKAGVDALRGPLESLLALAEKAISLAKSVGSGVSKGVSAVVSAGRSVTGRATGGPVDSNAPHWVGEKGPELFWPNGAGRIVPNHALGGGGISLTITGNTFMGEEGIAEKIGDNIIKVLKQNMKL